jgi:hypothetical protein
MKGRVLLAGVLAGLVSFFWGFFSHSVLMVSERAMKTIPNETAVMAALNENVKEPGLYFYPGASMTAADQNAAMKLFETQPRGVMVFTPPSVPMNMTQLFLTELVIDILGGIIAAWLLSMVAGTQTSFLARVGFVAMLGVFASLGIDAPYWNWYGFPTNYLIASFIDSAVGWGLAGVVLAWMIKPR